MPHAASSAAPRFDLLVTPLKHGIAEGRDAVIDALIRIQAPDAPDDMPERAPLELSLVLDRSGSMDGEPLAEAKRCAEMIVDHLGPKDRVAIVHFGSDIAVAAPIAPVTDRAAVKQTIQAIECNGMTALRVSKGAPVDGGGPEFGRNLFHPTCRFGSHGLGWGLTLCFV